MTEQTPAKLLSCPFCGLSVSVQFNEGQAYTDFQGFEQFSKDVYIIECRNRHAVRISDKDKNTAIEKWNTRATPSQAGSSTS